METLFRTESDDFKSLPWQTDILFTPGGIEQLKDSPVLLVCPLFFV
jgi:hypothetical protein